MRLSDLALAVARGLARRESAAIAEQGCAALASAAVSASGRIAKASRNRLRDLPKRSIVSPFRLATLLRATELREGVVDIPPVHDAVVVVIRRWITAAESLKDLHDRDDRL